MYGLDLALVWLRMPKPLLRLIAHPLTLATILFNINAGEKPPTEDPLAAAVHGVLPVLFVAVIEAARHLIIHTNRLSLTAESDKVPLHRWLLAPWSAWRLYRRMAPLREPSRTGSTRRPSARSSGSWRPKHGTPPRRYGAWRSAQASRLRRAGSRPRRSQPRPRPGSPKRPAKPKRTRPRTRPGSRRKPPAKEAEPELQATERCAQAAQRAAEREETAQKTAAEAEAEARTAAARRQAEEDRRAAATAQAEADRRSAESERAKAEVARRIAEQRQAAARTAPAERATAGTTAAAAVAREAAVRAELAAQEAEDEARLSTR